MKTRRKLRQRRLALPFDVPLHPVDYQRGKELFKRMVATLESK